MILHLLNQEPAPRLVLDSATMIGLERIHLALVVQGTLVLVLNLGDNAKAKVTSGFAE